MAIFSFQIMLLYFISIFFCFLFPETNSLSFNLPNIGPEHQNVKIKTFGDAYISSSDGLQVTSDAIGNLHERAGVATYIDLLPLWDKSTGKLTDFETHFVFVIDSFKEQRFGDGLTFFLADPDFLADPNGSDITPGGAMGLPIDGVTIAPPVDPDTILPTSPFVAVEFDTYSNTYQNGLPVDPNNISPATHVGIDVNSLISNVTAPWYCNVTHGIPNEAWIRYDSSSYNLSVVFTGSTNTTRVNDTIHFIVNLKDYLPESVAFGFSAATGAMFEKNNVKSWDFNSSLQSNDTNKNVTDPVVNESDRNVTDPVVNGINKNITAPVDPRPKKFPLGALVVIVIGSLVLVGGFGLVGFGLWKRSRANEEDEFEVEMSMENEFEADSGPKKFSYHELSHATNNFEDEQKLGEGGFGGVYRGFLRELNSYIAVKRISKGSKQGVKEYAAEVKIISRLRHRNLVQLIGWCHEKKELLLVYEFMENGSLDFHLFKGKSLLTWGTRYKIAQGLASALLYLHEEWEQCVVHRDIKSSNVMLDSNFNAKLGDFGLARFVDHEKESQTTVLAGTIGYLAPECVVTGKASKESDVYSFGVVALEIACGRKPFDLKVPESQMRLVEWVWDLYGMGRLLEAVDAKLGTDFDEQETVRLMIVGLWCAHPDHKVRPKIRQAIHVFNFEASMPILPPKQPALSFFSPPTTISNTSQNQYSSNTYNTDSSKFTSSSTPSSPSISLLNKE